MSHFFKQLFRFGWQQALCCVFPVIIFLTLAITQVIEIPLIYRYDLILFICILTQWLLIRSGWENTEELKVISIFHVIGLALEIYKVHMGSWDYPEPALTKIGGAPLYSGFMYSSVASYVCQAWKRFDMKFIDWPSKKVTLPTAFAIYLNFFTHHFLPDFRWFIIASLFIFFRKANVDFKVGKERYKMRLILSFFLIGGFIWIAENISTFFGAWQYPNQKFGWEMVHLGKFSSWFLLIIITVVIVANLKHKPEKRVIRI